MRTLTEQQKQESNIRAKAWRKKQQKENPEAFKKYNADRAKKLYHSNPKIAVKQQENFKKSYDENPEFREKVIRSASTGKYHWTPEQYSAKLEEQGGHCAICESTDGDAGRRMHIDHDHACCDGKPRTCGKCNRGVLCGPCNRRLAPLEALLRDFPNDYAEIYLRNTSVEGSWTKRALRYLKSYEKKYTLKTQENSE
jgi:hypothetical protein